MGTTDKRTHADENLTRCLTAYLIYKKENHQAEPSPFEIEMAIMTALDGLDTKYSCSEYLMAMKADFERIAITLSEMAKRHYREVARTEGKQDRFTVEDVKCYSVYEAAKIHRVTEETIRKAIREGRLTATGKPFKITESDLRNFKPKHWRRKN